MNAKAAAARRAVTYVQNGMILGLGTGSTAACAIEAIGERIRQEGLRVQGVPTSARSEELARQWNIPIRSLSGSLEIDLTIDGADEVDTALNLIKGGGGALVREKIVAVASRERLIIVDESKQTPVLGAFPLPVAVIPFGWESTQRQLQALCPDVRLRAASDGSPYRTDDGLYLLDLPMGRIEDPAALEAALKRMVGVVEVGLFVGLTTRLIVGYTDGRIEERVPTDAPA
jgi:ribose 5-phosphate isomerase A